MKFIVPSTFIVLLVAFSTAVGWLLKSPDFEPAVTSLALLATIIGLFADRWLAEKEKRKALLHTLVHEIYINLSILSSEPLKKCASAQSSYRLSEIIHIGTANSDFLRRICSRS